MKIDSKIKSIENRADSWANVLTGIGTKRDKIRSAQFEADGAVSDTTADALYHEDDVATRICEIMPEYAMRKKPIIKIKPDEEKTTAKSKTELHKETQKTQAEVNDKFKAIKASKTLVDGAVWANVYGGAVLILGVDDGVSVENRNEPLNEDNIKSFTHINVVDRRYVLPYTWYTDSDKPKFNTPEIYAITPFVIDPASFATDVLKHGVKYIHETRLVVMNGERTSITRKALNGGWSDSLLTRINKVLNQFGQSWDILPHLISDGNQAVFKMKGLIAAIAEDEEDAVQKRLELLDMNRSAARAVALDAEDEEYTRTPISWGGIKEPFELLQARLSAAARTPITKLFGRSPAGENATGESDTTNFQDEVEAFQESRLEDPVNRIVYLGLKTKDWPTAGKVPENWEVEFPALRTPTPKERVEIMSLMADADAKNILSNVLDPDEVAVSRFGPDGFSLDTTINIDSRQPPQTVEDFTPEPPPMIPGVIPTNESTENAKETDKRNSSGGTPTVSGVGATPDQK